MIRRRVRFKGIMGSKLSGALVALGGWPASEFGAVPVNRRLIELRCLATAFAFCSHLFVEFNRTTHVHLSRGIQGFCLCEQRPSPTNRTR